MTELGFVCGGEGCYKVRCIDLHCEIQYTVEQQ